MNIFRSESEQLAKNRRYTQNPSMSAIAWLQQLLPVSPSSVQNMRVGVMISDHTHFSLFGSGPRLNTWQCRQIAFWCFYKLTKSALDQQGSEFGIVRKGIVVSAVSVMQKAFLPA